MPGAAVDLLPKLTDYDPPSVAEGSIDPLGLYAIADRLAARLAPGIRERQSHPRFLTVTAVSIDVCREFDEERVAKDGVSEPWQVFEWYVVEGLVRHFRSAPNEIQGVPGTDKVRRAVQDRVPVSRSRYLKTPTAFGFHAVYRVLARELRIEFAGHLEEGGYELLSTWADEQGLSGFVGTTGGEGRRWRDVLVNAIGDGLDRGATDRSNGWAGWEFIGRHLAPRDIGRREADVIRTALRDPAGGFREPLLGFLTTPSGRELWESMGSERRFHEGLMERAENGLRTLLQTIMLYETFARLLQDAFQDCLRAMSLAQRRLTPTALGKEQGVSMASERVPSLYGEVLDALEAFGEADEFTRRFKVFAERLQGDEWVARLLGHHERIQREKPPHGKAPWCERFDDGSYVIRPPYRTDVEGTYNDSYVHAYRTRPLWDFAADLKLVR